MKKLLLIAIVFFGLQGYAQKTFEVYNFTSMAVQIGDIVTNASGTYPEFHSKATPFTIPAGGSYTLTNTGSTTRFPFQSPTSSPYIPTWERLNSPTSSVVMASPAAWVLGSPQVFDRMIFGIGGFGYNINTTNTASFPVTGPGFTAEYSVFSSGTTIVYTIIIY